MVNADDLRLDGNAAGGLFQEIFGFEMSTVKTVCAACAAEKPIGALIVYRHGMGTVLRCEGCDNVLMCIACIRGKYRLNFSGMSAFEINAQIH